MTTLSVSFGQLTVGPADRVLLRDVNLEIEGPGMTVILGASGSGKTTLLHILAGLLDPPDDGTAMMGRRAASSHEGRRLIPQQPNLLVNRTIEQNISIPLELAGRYDSVLIDSVLERLLLSEARRVPVRLASGGEQMRTVIARELALANRSSALFADEPTASLDATTRRECYEALNLVARDHLVVVVAHDDDALDFADNVIEIAHSTVRVRRA
ncbi:MAG: ATP-binding cassette domain-containing protein [bacterium]|nr:ATP-binding cassette domain-containing protein [bacterium]